MCVYVRACVLVCFHCFSLQSHQLFFVFLILNCSSVSCYSFPVNIFQLDHQHKIFAAEHCRMNDFDLLFNRNAVKFWIAQVHMMDGSSEAKVYVILY